MLFRSAKIPQLLTCYLQTLSRIPSSSRLSQLVRLSQPRPGVTRSLTEMPDQASAPQRKLLGCSALLLAINAFPSTVGRFTGALTALADALRPIHQPLLRAQQARAALRSISISFVDHTRGLMLRLEAIQFFARAFVGWLRDAATRDAATSLRALLGRYAVVAGHWHDLSNGLSDLGQLIETSSRAFREKIGRAHV